MLSSEVIPSKENRLHRGMMFEALAVSVGQASEPADLHTHQSFDDPVIMDLCASLRTPTDYLGKNPESQSDKHRLRERFCITISILVETIRANVDAWGEIEKNVESMLLSTQAIRDHKERLLEAQQ